MPTNLCANPNAKVLRPKNCDLSSALSQAAFRTDTRRFSSSQIAPNFLMASNRILLDRFFSAYFCLTTIILTLITHKVQRVSRKYKSDGDLRSSLPFDLGKSLLIGGFRSGFIYPFGTHKTLSVWLIQYETYKASVIMCHAILNHLSLWQQEAWYIQSRALS